MESHLLPPLPLVLKSVPGLWEMAHNFLWSWSPAQQDLFSQINPSVWENTQNPLVVIKNTYSLEHLGPDFFTTYQKVYGEFKTYLSAPLKGKLTAYLCAEYGLHTCFNQYSGGLGILAGDHCKQASDDALSFVAVGLLYRQGYFQQSINHRGAQEHGFPENRLDWPLIRALDAQGKPITVQIPFPGRLVHAALWQVRVGRISLYMLDTYLPENSVEDRLITHMLYTSGREMRLCQELVLGVGGVLALERLGLVPHVWHLNEGHSALSLVARLVAQKSPVKQALETVRASTVFTIHTPVPAGNERFDGSLMSHYLEPVLKGSTVTVKDILPLGQDSENNPSIFDMTAFCLRLARDKNGVSLLHGKTAHNTWTPVLPKGDRIMGITNGVHMPTWVGSAIAHLPHPVEPNKQLWLAHQVQKKRLIAQAHHILKNQYVRFGFPLAEVESISLSPQSLVIGFARRFATYKRATLLFSQIERVQKLFAAHPIVVLFAGKAHPADQMGQELIKEVFLITQKTQWKNKVYFLENYDMTLGSLLVQGCDIWLNNPRRPLEASGTSGMKAAANGVPNASILDGWWDEGFKGNNGWAIGDESDSTNEGQQDKHDADALYSVLEKQIIPSYFKGDQPGLSEEWLKIMAAAINTSYKAFSMGRMLDEYREKMYRVG